MPEKTDSSPENNKLWQGVGVGTAALTAASYVMWRNHGATLENSLAFASGVTGTYGSYRMGFKGPNWLNSRIGNEQKGRRAGIALSAFFAAAGGIVVAADRDHPAVTLAPPSSTVAPGETAAPGAPVTAGDAAENPSSSAGAVDAAPDNAERGTCEIPVLPLADNDAHGLKQVQAVFKEAGFDPNGIDGQQGEPGDLTDEAATNWKLANHFAVVNPDGSITSKRFNFAMCAIVPSLNDGDPNTPVIP